MKRTELLTHVTAYVKNAVKYLSRNSYQQEAAYVNGLIAKLEGDISLGEGNGIIYLRATSVNDRGPGCAENVTGADFALVFRSIGNAFEDNKAILAQAKNGDVERLRPADKRMLLEQCSKMSKYTEHYFVLEAPLEDGEIPKLRIGSHKDKTWSPNSIGLDEYLVDFVISCKHGDRREDFISAVQKSNLKQLNVVTLGLDFEPDPKPDPKPDPQPGPKPDSSHTPLSFKPRR